MKYITEFIAKCWPIIISAIVFFTWIVEIKYRVADHDVRIIRIETAMNNISGMNATVNRIATLIEDQQKGK